ncbi:MAG: GTPase [Ruminococcaceae bacterium]|nr:GTPase [Oscillospiraceae bacterium]
MKLPVYLFTGFLEGGKTSIIQESLNDEKFNTGEKTLVILCEEGFTELDPSQFWGKNVTIHTVDDKSWLTRENLEGLTKNRKLDRIIIEYNGMWELKDLYAAFPSGWAIYQNMMFADANTFINYNANMRQLVFDKLSDAEMIVLNRTPANIDKEEIHKIVRGITRRAAIVYDYPDGHVEYDDIEDPLPFDIDAPIIEIDDADYALWYRDLSENMADYNGKVVKFKGLIAADDRLPSNSLVIGRPVMTCCADDIQYSGLISVFKNAGTLKTGDWITVKGTIKIEKHKLYRNQGPVLYVESTEFAVQPKQPVATFY